MTIAKVLDKKRVTTTGENAGRYHIKIRLTKTEDKKTEQKYYLTVSKAANGFNPIYHFKYTHPTRCGIGC